MMHRAALSPLEKPSSSVDVKRLFFQRRDLEQPELSAELPTAQKQVSVCCCFSHVNYSNMTKSQHDVRDLQGNKQDGDHCGSNQLQKQLRLHTEGKRQAFCNS
ncbi:hypothetical protein XENOCAPTIV_004129 [Xenoophorus captivus]|uniref:Uncharacterized protein n=1 Tax=Xenoophorus captivus TaxID=1517983 RepID=A0ABV0QR08_9TELE